MITSRIDAITSIPEEYLSEAPPAPKSTKIELTSICNFRCGFCALRTRNEKAKHMPLVNFRRYSAMLREAGGKELGVFYIGESATHPDLVEAIRVAKQELGYPYVFLTTNGSLMTPSLAERCMAAGLDSLKFSMNYSNPRQFAEITGISARHFETCVRNLIAVCEVRTVMGYKTKVYASSILFDGKQREEMDGVVERFIDAVDEHYYLPLYSMGAQATEREAELGYKPTAGNQGRIGALREPLPCWSVFTEGHVTVDGKLSACCFDAAGRWHMGDLNTQTFMEAWHSDKFKTLRRAHLARDVSGTACEKCVAY